MKDYVASTRIWYLCIIYIVSLLCKKGLAIEVHSSLCNLGVMERSAGVFSLS